MRDIKDSQKSEQKIPDLDIIDLDAEPEEIQEEVQTDAEKETSAQNIPDSAARGKRPFKKFFSRINTHVILAAIVLICVFAIVHKFTNWGTFIDLDELFKDGQSEYSDTFDSILPLLDENSMPIYSDGTPPTIVVFGNAPFADDRNSKDSLANIIAEMSGATIYNCAVTGSFLASLPYDYESAEPMNIFNFYWLCHLATGNLVDKNFHEGMERLGDNAPPEAQEVYDTIKSIDFSQVDVIAVMYDASDYLAGHPMYSDENPTDIDQFTGNLEAGIQLLQSAYPHIRIIVMSPPYAYAVEDDGSYVSSDIKRYGQDVLSTYVIMQYASCSRNSVTFLDNLYGTITEDNAGEYLIDNLHLNVKGRKKVAERFIYALEYYNNK